MKLLLLFLLGVAVYSTALPYYYNKNVRSVRPNCPDGQVWVGKQCRVVWRLGNFYDNMYPQRAFDLRGQYYPIIRSVDLLDVQELECPEGSRKDALGNCRKRLPPPEQS